jgi:hypothetical protein
MSRLRRAQKKAKATAKINHQGTNTPNKVGITRNRFVVQINIVRWAEIDGGVCRGRIDRSVFCGAQSATTACGSGIDPRLSISNDFFCSFSFSERKGGD